MKIIFISILLLSSVHAKSFASNQKVERLIDNLERATSNFEIAKANYFLALHHVKSKPQEAKLYIINCLKNITLTDSTVHVGKAHFLAGNIDYQLSNHKEAAKHYHYSIGYLQKANNTKNLVKSYIALGVLALNINDLSNADQYIYEAIKLINNKFSNDLGLALSYKADLHYEKEQYDSALFTYQLAQRHISDSAFFSYKLLRFYITKKDIPQAKNLLNQLLTQASTFTKYQNQLVRIQQIKLLEYQGKLQQALTLIKETEKEAKSFNDIYATILYRKFKVLNAMNKTAAAMQTAKALVAYSNIHKLNSHLLNYYPTLIDYAETTQAYEAGFAWQQALNTLRKDFKLPQTLANEVGKVAMAEAALEYAHEIEEAALQEQLQKIVNLLWIILGFTLYAALYIAVHHRMIFVHGIMPYLRYGKGFAVNLKAARSHQDNAEYFKKTGHYPKPKL